MLLKLNIKHLTEVTLPVLHCSISSGLWAGGCQSGPRETGTGCFLVCLHSLFFQYVFVCFPWVHLKFKIRCRIQFEKEQWICSVTVSGEEALCCSSIWDLNTLVSCSFYIKVFSNGWLFPWMLTPHVVLVCISSVSLSTPDTLHYARFVYHHHRFGAVWADGCVLQEFRSP